MIYCLNDLEGLIPLRDCLKDNWASLGLEINWEDLQEFQEMLDDIEWWSSMEGGFRRPGEWPGFHPVHDRLWMTRHGDIIELKNSKS